VPNKPTFQLDGCRHSAKWRSSRRALATTAAKRAASALLSPSRANWSSAAVGGHAAGTAARRRRVSPPPGIKGRALNVTGEVYAEKRFRSAARGVAAQSGELGGRRW